MLVIFNLKRESFIIRKLIKFLQNNDFESALLQPETMVNSKKSKQKHENVKVKKFKIIRMDYFLLVSYS